MDIKELFNRSILLLEVMIETPSFSREEGKTAELITAWFKDCDIAVNRKNNNVWASNKHFDPSKPTILLNSHHDTVRPNKGYTNDPFEARLEDGMLFGLGSNDAGGSLVSLMATFVHFYNRKDLKYNLIMAATGEEENSGPNGISCLLDELPRLDFAVIGEPTQMHMAVAEKGLLVIDAKAPGVSGHAAHENTENAIYNALKDINWISSYHFPKVSDLLGVVKMTVTQIKAGDQHNVVPASCDFVIDVRVNEHYTNQEVFEIINEHTKSELKARSFRLNSSSIPMDHPIVKTGISMGRNTYGSPTLSDQAVLGCPSLKIGPGDSSRSHQADEFIYVNEIEEGIDQYIKLFSEILKTN